MQRFLVLIALLSGPAFAADGDSSTGVIASLLNVVKSFISTLWEKITGFTEWLVDVVKLAFESLWDMAKDAFSWVFEQVLELVASAIDAMYSESGADALVSQVMGAWSGLPPEVTQVASALGLGTAMTMIAAAIFLRILLQLIPFTRLGS